MGRSPSRFDHLVLLLARVGSLRLGALGLLLGGVLVLTPACDDDGVGATCMETKECRFGLICDRADNRCKRPADVTPPDAAPRPDAAVRDAGALDAPADRPSALDGPVVDAGVVDAPAADAPAPADAGAADGAAGDLGGPGPDALGEDAPAGEDASAGQDAGLPDAEGPDDGGEAQGVDAGVDAA